MPTITGSVLLASDNLSPILFEKTIRYVGDESFLEILWRALAVKYAKDEEDIKSKARVWYGGAYGGCEDYPLAIITARWGRESEYIGEDWKSFDEGSFPLNRYLSQFCQTKVFVNSERQLLHIFTDGIPGSKWARALASCFGRLLTWYYPSETDEVKNFYKSISVDNKALTEQQKAQIVADFANSVVTPEWIRVRMIKNALNGYANGIIDAQLSRLESSINENSRYLQECYSNAEKYLTAIVRSQSEYNALAAGDKKSDDKFIEFFQSHKNLRIFRVDKANGVIHYGVKDTLEYYDVDELEANLQNENSWMHNRYDKSFLELIKWLLVEKRGIISVVAMFTLGANCLVRPERDCTFDIDDSMPNPHIYFYGCSGANDNYYRQYANEGDWELGIEQSISATKNWSVGDVTVGKSMFDYINEHDERFILISDGSRIEDPSQATRAVNASEFVEIVREKIKEEKEKEQNVKVDISEAK